jgi:hypothetical protein
MAGPQLVLYSWLFIHFPLICSMKFDTYPHIYVQSRTKKNICIFNSILWTSFPKRHVHGGFHSDAIGESRAVAWQSTWSNFITS